MSLITTRVVHERAGTFPSRSSSAWLSSACICSACAAALAPAVATHWWSPPDAPPNWSRRSSALSSALHLAQRMIRRRCFVVFGQGRAFSFFYLKIAGVRCLPPNCRSRYTFPRQQINNSLRSATVPFIHPSGRSHIHIPRFFLVNNARRRQCLHGQARRAGGALRGDGARTQPSTHTAPLSPPPRRPHPPASPPTPNAVCGVVRRLST